MRRSYHDDLLNYLKDFRDISLSTEKSLKSNLEYLNSVLNSESATDHNTLLSLQNLLDKFSYLNKYYDIAIKFFEV